MSIWPEITHDGQTLHHIGIKVDGTLWNPNGYPEDMVRTAIAGAEARAHERRSKAAHKAAATRARRRVLKINRIVQEYRAKGSSSRPVLAVSAAADFRIRNRSIAASAQSAGRMSWQRSPPRRLPRASRRANPHNRKLGRRGDSPCEGSPGPFRAAHLLAWQVSETGVPCRPWAYVDPSGRRRRCTG